MGLITLSSSKRLSLETSMAAASMMENEVARSERQGRLVWTPLEGE